MKIFEKILEIYFIVLFFFLIVPTALVLGIVALLAELKYKIFGE